MTIVWTSQPPIDPDVTLTGEPDADTLEAGSGDDVIIGRAGDDVIRSGLGTDTIIFGELGGGLALGRDQLWGTLAELNGDTVTDFASNDGIGVLDETGAVVAARLVIGNGEIGIDAGSDGTIDAVVSVGIGLSGIGTSLSGPSPFTGATRPGSIQIQRSFNAVEEVLLRHESSGDVIVLDLSEGQSQQQSRWNRLNRLAHPGNRKPQHWRRQRCSLAE